MSTREKLLLVWALGMTSLALVGGIILFQMLQPQIPASVRIGSAQEFVIGSHTLLECDRYAKYCRRIHSSSELAENMRFHDQYPSEFEAPWIWIARESENDWKALIAVSPHRGCFVDWFQEENRFREGCYGSKWMRDGTYLEGPSPRGLDSYPVRVENGDVLIDFKLVRGKHHD